MRRHFGLAALLVVLMIAPAWGFTIVPGEYSLNYGSSWDNPSENINAVLGNLNGDTQLMLVNGYKNTGGAAGGLETWFGNGAVSVILEELAGYKNNTTFGWYNVDNGSVGQIFTGADGKGAEREVVFGDPTSFGFYIDPNGISSNRMYTDHLLNTHGDFQVAVFKNLGVDNQYILGWEDLDLNGSTGGDRDYQDMILRITIRPVPEPGTMLFMGLVLLGLMWIGRQCKGRAGWGAAV